MVYSIVFSIIMLLIFIQDLGPLYALIAFCGLAIHSELYRIRIMLQKNN